MTGKSKETQRVAIRFGGRRMTVPKSAIDLYARELAGHPAFDAPALDCHMGMLYSGNIVPVTEFVRWYEFHGDWPALNIETIGQTP